MSGDTSWIELRLADEGNGRTLFRLNHIAYADNDRWATFGPGAVGVGWDSGLIGLSLHLTTGQAADPSRVAAWSASEEGHRFLTAASDAWYEASVAFGTDPAGARAAADRTTAFYTGSPKPVGGDAVLDSMCTD